MTDVGENSLVIECLTHRLHDADRDESYEVRVEDPLEIRSGSFVALLGPSGCGKTTLLTVLGLLRRVTHLDELKRFSMWFQNEDGERDSYDLKKIWTRNSRQEVETIRRRHIGFALQNGELLPALTVRENILTPLRFNGISGSKASKRVDTLLKAFHLDRPKQKSGRTETDTSSLADSRINRLSGGEYQRVALARAIAHWPELVLVDEPTANLNREMAFDALVQLRQIGTGDGPKSTVIMVTHDEQLAMEFADLIVRMEPIPGRPAGKVAEITPNVPKVAVADQMADAARG